jgi:hypothetical protein
MTMADPIIWKIMDGQLGLAVVDTAAVGYLDTWLAPAGKTVDTVTLADYDTSSATFMCQVTRAQITSSPSTDTEDVPASMCAPSKTIPTPGESSFSLEIGALADMNQVAGLQRFSFEHDAEECYVYIGFDGVNPPKAIGRVMMASLPLGGDMRSIMNDTVTWPFSSKPSIEFGNATDSEVVAPAAAAAVEPAAVEPVEEPVPAGF